MFVPGQNQLLANLSLLLFLRIFRSFVFMILKRTFEECVSLFSYQRSFFALPFVSNSFAIISCCFLPVKNFFNFFSKLFLFLSCSSFGSLSYLPLCCQELFSCNFSAFTERRRRDLNPRAATNDLLPFQGSPFSLLGISPYRFKREQMIL